MTTQAPADHKVPGAFFMPTRQFIPTPSHPSTTSPFAPDPHLTTGLLYAGPHGPAHPSSAPTYPLASLPPTLTRLLVFSTVHPRHVDPLRSVPYLLKPGRPHD